MNKREQITASFEKYIPHQFVGYVVDLLFQYPVHFKVSKPRRTKLGDYRPQHQNKPHRITVNADLNPYAFLITTLHEFAHLHTYLEFGNKVNAHGVEWKQAFKKLLAPLLSNEALPEDIRQALQRSMGKLKASSCTDAQLYRVLKRYDKRAETSFLLEDLSNNSLFELGGKSYKRGILRRTRYLCEEVRSGRPYLISRLAEVQLINENQEHGK